MILLKNRPMNRRRKLQFFTDDVKVGRLTFTCKEIVVAGGLQPLFHQLSKRRTRFEAEEIEGFFFKRFQNRNELFLLNKWSFSIIYGRPVYRIDILRTVKITESDRF